MGNKWSDVEIFALAEALSKRMDSVRRGDAMPNDHVTETARGLVRLADAAKPKRRPPLRLVWSRPE